jgi:hypothetical protein
MLVSNLVLVLLILLIFSGCEDGSRNGSQPPRSGMDSLEDPGNNLEKMDTVTYMAVLNPVNTAVAGEAYGSFTFHKDQDFIVANVWLNNSAPIVTQTQKVHLGTACPTEADDINFDGYIDVEEAGKVSGNVIIPLDGDISNQYSLLGMYPISDAWGAYVYSRTGSFSEFYQDLYDFDVNPDDEVVKMTGPLDLAGKTVLIYGMEEHVEMPETVATSNGLTPNQSLPIACGVITLVTEIPGTFEPDDITIGHVPAPIPQPTRPGSFNPGPGSRNPRPGSYNPRPGRPNRPTRPGTNHPSNPNADRECRGDVGKECE